MTCNPLLPNTGVGGSVLLVLVVGIVGVVLGLAVLLRARRSRGRAAAHLVLVLVLVSGGVALGLTPTLPAEADCQPSAEPTVVRPSGPVVPDNSLTITQTSVMENLRPGAAPVPITGLVVNNGPDSTFITAIRVEIVGVTRATGAAAGRCDASDYRLLDTRMPVGRTLEANGGWTTFAGAAIGFANKPTNQDSCQRATVRLRYRTL